MKRKLIKYAIYGAGAWLLFRALSRTSGAASDSAIGARATSPLESIVMDNLFQ